MLKQSLCNHKLLAAVAGFTGTVACAMFKESFDSIIPIPAFGYECALRIHIRRRARLIARAI